MRYFPNKLPKGRLPDREYFFNILMTVHGQFLIALIEHASKQRNEAGADKEAKEVINISPEWWDKLTSVPFKSCKLKSNSHILQPKKEEPFISWSMAPKSCQQRENEKSLISQDRSEITSIKLDRASQDPRWRPTWLEPTKCSNNPRMWKCQNHRNPLSRTWLHIARWQVEEGPTSTNKTNDWNKLLFSKIS